MSVGHDILRHAGPGILGGATCGDWLRILRDNGFAVDPRYWPRAWGITALSVMNSVLGRREERRHASAVNTVDVPPPLFVLGVWRSGTTHLHNLLTQDQRFGFPNLYEVLNPHVFLDGGARGADRLERMVSHRRAMDDMRQGAYEPVEEDVAMAALGMSSMLGLVFPRSRDRYWRYVTMDGIGETEVERWRAAYGQLLRKLTVAKGRRLVLKSPANTARIPLLLGMFPGARFVNIHRHPHEVYRSTLHSLNVTSSWWRVQNEAFGGEWIMRSCGQVFDAYFRDRDLVPAEHLCEVAYADLERDPVRELERIYGSLGLPDFDPVRDDVQAYVDSIRGYARNRYPDLSATTRDRLAVAWEQAFTEWGYEV